MSLKDTAAEAQPYLILSIAVAFALVFPWLMQDGMFMDGLLYADVAHNYADGIGTFWHPQTDDVINFEFFHQPPLVFFLESWFFKLIPNSIFPERIYCLFMLFITILLIRLVWRNLTQHSVLQSMYFLPIFF